MMTDRVRVGVLLLSLVGLYGTLIPDLVGDWMRSGDYSHGFLIPVVSVWLLWDRREKVSAIPSRPFFPGALVVAGAVMQMLIGVASAELFLQRSSLVLFLIGWTLLVWGVPRLRALWFPFAYLLFMIPLPAVVWYAMAFPLQLLASQVTATALTMAGMEAVRLGNVIQLPGCTLEVADACSGLRSLVALSALAALLAEGSLVPGRGPGRPVGRMMMFLAAVPVSIVANVLRVGFSAGVAAAWRTDVVSGGLHELLGLLLFVLAGGMLLALREGLAWVEETPRRWSQ
ncbi:MAG: exosortase/archaeosortase family protein [Gemmatimonadota bacterium]|jgi:exosortase|nr:exosortase [Gemmatimonadota bacterium]MDP6529430.1 exosortase/archaeosortase family protein [Gemmatimonadota bacterium]MDP7031617.1 exosortase/archaeosortase family protein [Gemmatimonadota bacterium]